MFVATAEFRPRLRGLIWAAPMVGAPAASQRRSGAAPEEVVLADYIKSLKGARQAPRNLLPANARC